MPGRQEVSQLTNRLDSTFARIETISADLELRADFARYLCVLVSGYVERGVTALILEYCRGSASPSIRRFVESRLRRFTNPNATRVGDLLGNFDHRWKQSFDLFVVDERRAALDSVPGLRNQIAHGESVGLTYARISHYYAAIKEIIQHIADLCDPLE